MKIDHGKVNVSQCNFRIKSKQVIQFESDSSNYNMPPVAKKNVMPLHPKSRVWEYFGDSFFFLALLLAIVRMASEITF